MRNIIGQPVSGSDYFERPAITNLIYRRLDSGANLFMAAPRRVGKTSIMFHLRDKPKEGYNFLYVNTESVDSSETFFKQLFDVILNSSAISKKVKLSKSLKTLIANVTERVKSVGAFSIEVQFENKPKEKYSEIFFELMKNLKNTEDRIVMMIDEYPSTIENIHQKEDLNEAVIFLKFNRTIRQQSAGGIQFIYTGSIGLPNIVDRLNVPESINDLNQIEISPLAFDEAAEFIEQLLKVAKVPYKYDAITYLINKVRWLTPFFIQLSVQELVDLYDANPNKIDHKTVDQAFENICNRRNNLHFDSYYKRLKDSFLEDDYNLALAILNSIAEHDKVYKQDLLDSLIAEKLDKRDVVAIIESLEFDGYIKQFQNTFSFNSPILQLWWNKYVRI